MKKINFTHEARVARRKIKEISQWESYADRWQPSQISDKLMAIRYSCKLKEDFEKEERLVKGALANSRRLLADALRSVKTAETSSSEGVKTFFQKNFEVYWEQHKKRLREIGMSR